jgi:hypothetical protein
LWAKGLTAKGVINKCFLFTVGSVCPVKLGRPRCRWVDNIKINLREIEWGGMDWIDLA